MAAWKDHAICQEINFQNFQFLQQGNVQQGLIDLAMD